MTCYLGTFVKLLPLAHAHNTRIILINRRDYPGTTPYTDEERAALLSCRDVPADDTRLDITWIVRVPTDLVFGHSIFEADAFLVKSTECRILERGPTA